MHQRYRLSKNKQNEWFTYCKDEQKYVRNPSKRALIYELRAKNNSSYCRLYKNKLIVSIKTIETK